MYTFSIARPVLDEATLTVNLLQFRAKSFAFERTVTLGGTAFSLFARTETESESQFRPKLVRLRVVVPTAWIRYDETADALLLGPEGGPPLRPNPGTARESAAEAPEFREQGTDWVRHGLGDRRILYVPKEFAAVLFGADGQPAADLRAESI